MVRRGCRVKHKTIAWPEMILLSKGLLIRKPIVRPVNGYVAVGFLFLIDNDYQSRY